MASVKRRDFLATLLTSALLPSYGHGCEVTRDAVGDLKTKRYACNFGSGKLNATYLRVSDMLFSRIIDDADFPEVESLFGGAKLRRNAVLDTYENLLSRYGYEFNFYPRLFAYGERSEYGSHRSEDDATYLSGGMTARTVGVWDDPRHYPVFPLADEFRKLQLLEDYGDTIVSFLRFADLNDFSGLEAKLSSYVELFRQRTGDAALDSLQGSNLTSLETVPHLVMMRDIEAGAVEDFLPIYGLGRMSDDCNGGNHYGIFYNPPALFVDLVVLENAGDGPLDLDGLYGARDPASYLRRAATNRAPDEHLSGEGITLAPGQRIVIPQALTFKSLQSALFPDAGTVGANYGPVETVRGMMIGGERIPFASQTRNALILASDYPGLCCPYLSYRSPQSRRFVMAGKVLCDACGAENAMKEGKTFDGFVEEFSLMEKEHERTYLQEAFLIVHMMNGESHRLAPKLLRLGNPTEAPLTIDLGEEIKLCFSLPGYLCGEDIISSELVLSGYYETYSGIMARRSAA